MKIVLTPDWFLGKDVLIEGFSFLVLLIFFFFCLKYYKLSKKKNRLYLGIGFLLIAIAQLATILTKLVLYYDTSFTQQIGQLVITYQIVKSIDVFYYAGFFFHKLLTLLGLFIIYRLPLKKKTIGDFLLVLYFVAVSFVSKAGAYYLFHITVFVLLALIIENYSKIYNKNKSKNTLVLIAAFGMLALSQAIFILSKLSLFFVIANLIELASYLILLILIIRILKNGKKKKSYGHNMGYAKHHTRKRR